MNCLQVAPADIFKTLTLVFGISLHTFLYNPGRDMYSTFPSFSKGKHSRSPGDFDFYK